MKKRVFETIIGFIVLFCSALFLVFAIKGVRLPTANTYKISARFENVDGILTGSDVKIGGIKIGEVTKQELDNNSYTAVITMNIDRGIKLPEDSSIKIMTTGLIGNKYLAIEPGADTVFIKDEGEIYYTQSTVNLEDLISRFVFDSE